MKGLALAMGGAALAILIRVVVLVLFPEGGKEFLVHAIAMLIMAITAFWAVWKAPMGKPLDFFKSAAKQTSIFALLFTLYTIAEHTVIYPDALVHHRESRIELMNEANFDSLKVVYPEQLGEATREEWEAGHRMWIERTTSPKVISTVTLFGYLVLGWLYSAIVAIFGPKIKGA